MTTHDDRVARTATARELAAELFATAARHPDAGLTVQMRCHAACVALQGPNHPVPPVPVSPHPDQLVARALRTLAELDIEDFSHPDVLAAARHGRRALTATS